MRTRIFILIGIIGLVVWWFGSSQTDKLLPLLGVTLTIIGFVGAYYSASRKKGFRLFKWL